MFETFSILSRIALIVGVLVALTPCGICHQGMGQGPAVCSMKHMSGKMDCCHKSKPASPLCKVMDQSSTVSAVKNLAPAPMVVVRVVLSPAFVLAEASVVPSLVLDTSPSRAPLSLRI